MRSGQLFILERKGQSFNWDASGHSAILATIGHSSLDDPDALGATPVDYKGIKVCLKCCNFYQYIITLLDKIGISIKFHHQLSKPEFSILINTLLI
jgi:hypothetical protein